MRYGKRDVRAVLHSVFDLRLTVKNALVKTREVLANQLADALAKRVSLLLGEVFRGFQLGLHDDQCVLRSIEKDRIDSVVIEVVHYGGSCLFRCDAAKLRDCEACKGPRQVLCSLFSCGLCL